MLDRLFKNRKERKQKDLQEQELKKSLAEKVSKYEQHDDTTNTDYTNITIDGKKLRVAKEHITLNEPWKAQDSKPSK